MISKSCWSSSRGTTAQVVGGQQVDRDDPDAEVVAPAQELDHLRGAGAVTVGGRLERALARPAPVAVDDHRDVVGQRRIGQFAAKAGLIEAVEEARAARSPSAHAHAYASRPSKPSNGLRLTAFMLLALPRIGP